MNSRTDQRSILYLAAFLSIIAGVIHVLVTPEHFSEWWGYGLFFAATVMIQILYVPAVIQWPRQPVLLAGILSNAAIVAMWVISRSIGTPFFGPGAGEIEAVGTLDAIATVSEIALIAILAAVAFSGVRQAPPDTSYQHATVPDTRSFTSKTRD